MSIFNMKYEYLLMALVVLMAGCTTQSSTDTQSGLSPEAISALDEAINDEYRAHATYVAVIEKFGEVAPFTSIKNAEEQHISSLKELYVKYNVPIPNDTWLGNVTAPDTIQDACRLGVQAEIDNAKLYREKLLPMVEDYPDITFVFERLMNASQYNHLPAFESCS